MSETCAVCGDPLQPITRGGAGVVCPEHGWPKEPAPLVVGHGLRDDEVRRIEFLFDEAYAHSPEMPDVKQMAELREAIDAALVPIAGTECGGTDLESCVLGRLAASECEACGHVGDYGDPFCSKCQSGELVQSSAPCPKCCDDSGRPLWSEYGVQPGYVPTKCGTCWKNARRHGPEPDDPPCGDCFEGMKVAR